jgi:hypothetical protein
MGDAFASWFDTILGMVVCFNLVIFGWADWAVDATRGWCMLVRVEAVED